LTHVVALALGVKESSLVNNVFTVINILVVLFVIIAGCINVNTENWNLKKDDIPDDAGEGGFFPFGVSGAIAGAATCFYGFVGFDCIATTGEEVRNPKRAIPIAIIGSLMIIFLSYFGVSTVLTLMEPYYLLDPDAPITKVFIGIGWTVAKWIVTVGALFGLCASFAHSMFPLPRIIYAMSNDGLIFKFLGQVSKRFKTPFYGTIFAGFLTGLMAALFDLEKLVNMMSIGTLLAYTIVAACVILLRYTNADPYESNDDISPEYVESTKLVSLTVKVSFNTVTKQIFCPLKHPTSLSSSIVAVEVLIFSIMSALLSVCIIYWKDGLESLDPFAVSVTSVIAGCLVIIVLSLSFQPTSKTDLTFQVKLLPLIPALSILINVYLMLNLDQGTWIRFGIWMLVGLLIYFLYGVKKSKAPFNSTKQLQITKGEVNEAHNADDQKSWKTNQSITPEFTDTNDMSENNEEVVLRKNSQSKLEDEDIRRSLKCIEDLEKILDFNENMKFDDITMPEVDEVKSSNSRENEHVNVENVGDVVSLPASVMSEPANDSLLNSTPPENNKNLRKNKKFSTASLYPNVIVVSYGSDTESIDIKDNRNISDDVDSPIDKKDIFLQELDPQTDNGVFDPPSPPPLPPPLSAPLIRSVSSPEYVNTSSFTSISAPTPPPLPPLSPNLSTSASNLTRHPSKNSTQFAKSSSNASPETNSLNENSSVSESGYSTNGNGTHSFSKYKTEPGSPETDTQFLLRMGSLKNSNFAQKLESMLKEKLYTVKPVEPEYKKTPKFTKNSANNQHKNNTTEKFNRWTVDPTLQLNKNVKNQKTVGKTNDRALIEENEQINDEDDDRENIKWKLEKFFANRSELPVFRRHTSQPNLTLMISGEDENGDFKKENKYNDPEDKLRTNLEKNLIDDGKNFDIVKKQRLLMGEVLASIKFVSNKSPASSIHDDLDLGSLSDNNEDNEEVFEELPEISPKTLIRL
ncbi:hypothetical protein L9F63_018406, partial [Diploptera punctata]